MVRTLDARTSQSSNGFPPEPLFFTHNVPVLIAQTGLLIHEPGPLIRTLFSGIVSVICYQLSDLASISVEVFRGVDRTGVPIYRVSKPVIPGWLASPAVLRYSGADYNVPAPADGQLVYSVYATLYRSTANYTGYRRGPESFNATAYCED